MNNFKNIGIINMALVWRGVRDWVTSNAHIIATDNRWLDVNDEVNDNNDVQLVDKVLIER